MRYQNPPYSQKYGGLKKLKYTSGSSLESKRKNNKITINIDSNNLGKGSLLNSSFEHRKGSVEYSPQGNYLPNIRSSLEYEPPNTILASSIPVVDQEWLYAIEEFSNFVRIFL